MGGRRTSAARRREPGRVVFRDHLYAIGGRSGFSDYGTVYIYDPASDTWAKGPPIPPRGTAGAVVYRGAIFVFGGESQRRNKTAQLVEHLRGKEAPTGTRVIDRCRAVLETNAGPISAAFPTLTNYSPTSPAAVAQPRLQPPARKSAPSEEGRRSTKRQRVQNSPGERAGRMNVGR